MTELVNIRVIDPRVDINNTRNKTYGILSGGSQQTWEPFVSQSFSDSQISWSCPTPSKDVYVNRRVYIRMKFLLTFRGTSAGAGIPLLQAVGLPTLPGVNPGAFTFDAPRCNPLSQAFSTFAVQMNNDNISSNVNTYSRVFQRFNRTIDEENLDLSMTPSMADKAQSYDDLQGFALNPLAQYGDNVVETPRGGFAGAVITRNDGTGTPADVATVELTVTEPIWLSPFTFGRGQEDVALINIVNINLTATLGGRGNGALTGLCSALWSHAPAGSALTSAVASVVEGTALFNYISPPAGQSIPQSIVYSYFEPTLYPTASSAPVAAGASTTLTLNNIQLQSVPNRMYIWASERDQDVDITTTDTYFKITGLNITYGNQTGILSNMSEQDLYQMYLRNGGNSSFTQFVRHIGSVMCVSFGMDIPLEPMMAPSVRAQQNLRMQVNCTNIGPAAVIPTLNVLVIQEGTMTIMNGSVTRSVGVLDKQQVLNSLAGPAISFHPSDNIYGSSFWKDFGRIAKKLARPLIDIGTQAAAKFAPELLPVAAGADALASAFGMGMKRRGKRGGAVLTNRDMEKILS